MASVPAPAWAGAAAAVGGYAGVQLPVDADFLSGWELEQHLEGADTPLYLPVYIDNFDDEGDVLGEAPPLAGIADMLDNQYGGFGVPAAAPTAAAKLEPAPGPPAMQQQLDCLLNLFNGAGMLPAVLLNLNMPPLLAALIKPGSATTAALPPAAQPPTATEEGELYSLAKKIKTDHISDDGFYDFLPGQAAPFLQGTNWNDQIFASAPASAPGPAPARAAARAAARAPVTLLGDDEMLDAADDDDKTTVGEDAATVQADDDDDETWANPSSNDDVSMDTGVQSTRSRPARARRAQRGKRASDRRSGGARGRKLKAAPPVGPPSSVPEMSAVAAAVAQAGWPHNGEVEPDRACDRRRLLVRHMQAYATLGLCPNVVAGVEIRIKENVQGCYRKIVNDVLPLLFGTTYGPASPHYRTPAVFKAHVEIIRLATRGRVLVTEDEVCAGPASNPSIGPLVTKAKQTTPYYVNQAWLTFFKVDKQELMALFTKLPVLLFADADAAPALTAASALAPEEARAQ